MVWTPVVTGYEVDNNNTNKLFAANAKTSIMLLLKYSIVLYTVYAAKKNSAASY
jgi:hypothetical protein